MRKSSGENGVRDEGSLIERFRKSQIPLVRGMRALRIGIGDDAAIWRPSPGCETILTCDWFLEGTHFLSDWHPADSVGWKCLARAVSDIAAMGGTPRCFLLSLAMPKSAASQWLREFLQGLRSASKALRCPVAGGDTTRQTKVLINITVIGECRTGTAVPRSGARLGDAIFVTGRLGEAEYGLKLLLGTKRRADWRDRRLRKHLYPEPRLAIGSWLANNRMATAMMDLSDGLSSELPRLCSASGVGARLELNRVPKIKLATTDKKKFAATALALDGGDDYELLFTVAKNNVARIPKEIAGVPLTRIGEITSSKRVVLTGEDGGTMQLENRGWDPFR